MEQTVFRTYICSNCGHPFGWNEESEEAQAPDLCDTCREDGEESELVVDLNRCAPMTEEDRALLHREPWRLEQLRHNLPPGMVYCERCGNHVPLSSAAAHVIQWPA